jgi:rSAM/selenodomain-associated transferase 1
MRQRLVVFARQPVVGRVKSRLAAGIGAARAAAVYEALLEHTVKTARESRVEAEIWFAEDPDARWAKALGLPYETQEAGDLGRRMAGCFDHLFDGGSTKVVLIGSDTAHLEPDHILTAMDVLDDHPVVLGPADDGGYWLIGQQTPGFDLFRGIPWSRPTTLAATRARLQSLGADWFELESLPDIDTVEDLRRAVDDPRVDEALRRRLRSVAGSRI